MPHIDGLLCLCVPELVFHLSPHDKQAIAIKKRTGNPKRSRDRGNDESRSRENFESFEAEKNRVEGFGTHLKRDGPAKPIPQTSVETKILFLEFRLFNGDFERRDRFRLYCAVFHQQTDYLRDNGHQRYPKNR